jgi:thiamine pyrophosphokinase
MPVPCLIFAGGPEPGTPCLPVPEGYVICADSGLRLAERLHIKPDLVLGDFDSLGRVPAEYLHMTAPAEKDDTDTMLAVRTALEKGYDDIRICGAFGGRLDHTLANLQALEFLHEHGASGMLIGAESCACLQGPGTRRYPKLPGFSFSVFSWTARCTGVTLSGVHYPLENAVLTRSFPLGVSNEITAEAAEVTCGEGLLLLIASRL